MNEWRPVIGWEESYEVSDDGQVRGIDRWVDNGKGGRFVPGTMKAIRVASCCDRHNGYHLVTLCRNAKHIPLAVHSLVAAAFIGQLPHGHKVEHINGNKLDDHKDNLHYIPKETNIGWMNERKVC